MCIRGAVVDYTEECYTPRLPFCIARRNSIFSLIEILDMARDVRESYVFVYTY